MVKLSNKERKEITYQRALTLFQSYSTFLIADLDNITSLQIQNLRKEWYSDAEVLFGKNTVIKKALLHLALTNSFYQQVFDQVKNNIAFIFTNSNPSFITSDIVANQRNVFANIGMIAQGDVWIHKGVTSIKVDKTSKFQALNIPTKVTKGFIEIISDCLVLKEGDRVQPSQQDLLKMLNIKPFIFEVGIKKLCEEDHFYDKWVVDLKQADVAESCREAVARVCAIGLGANIPTEVGVPYEVIDCYRNMIAISLGSGYEIEEAKN